MSRYQDGVSSFFNLISDRPNLFHLVYNKLPVNLEGVCENMENKEWQARVQK